MICMCASVSPNPVQDWILRGSPHSPGATVTTMWSTAAKVMDLQGDGVGEDSAAHAHHTRTTRSPRRPTVRTLFLTDLDRDKVEIRPIKEARSQRRHPPTSCSSTTPHRARRGPGRRGRQGFQYLLDGLNPEADADRGRPSGSGGLARPGGERYARGGRCSTADRREPGRRLRSPTRPHLDAAELVLPRPPWLYDNGLPCGREANTARPPVRRRGFHTMADRRVADTAAWVTGGIQCGGVTSVRRARHADRAHISQEMILNFLSRTPRPAAQLLMADPSRAYRSRCQDRGPRTGGVGTDCTRVLADLRATSSRWRTTSPLRRRLVKGQAAHFVGATGAKQSITLESPRATRVWRCYIVCWSRRDVLVANPGARRHRADGADPRRTCPAPDPDLGGDRLCNPQGPLSLRAYDLLARPSPGVRDHRISGCARQTRGRRWPTCRRDCSRRSPSCRCCCVANVRAPATVSRHGAGRR